jgi:hypothetical protein
MPNYASILTKPLGIERARNPVSIEGLKLSHPTRVQLTRLTPFLKGLVYIYTAEDIWATLQSLNRKVSVKTSITAIVRLRNKGGLVNARARRAHALATASVGGHFMVMPDTARVSLSRSLIRYVSQHGTREGLEGPFLTALVFLKEHGFMSDYTEGVDCWNQLSPPRPPSGNVIFYDSLGHSLGALPPSVFGDTRDASSIVSSALGRDDVGQALLEQSIDERFSMVGSSSCESWVTAAFAFGGAVAGGVVGAKSGGGVAEGAAKGFEYGKELGEVVGPVGCGWVSNDTATPAPAESPDDPPDTPDTPDTPKDEDDGQTCDFPPDTEMPAPDDSDGGGNPVAVLATFSLLSKAQAASMTSTLFQNTVHVNDLPQYIGNIPAGSTLRSLGLSVPNVAATTLVDAASLVALTSVSVVDPGVLTRVPVYNQKVSSTGL